MISTTNAALHKDLHREIHAILCQELPRRVESVETDLFQAGLLDSQHLVHVIPLLEDHFGVNLPMEAIDVDSFRSVAAIANLIAARRQESAAPEVVADQGKPAQVETLAQEIKDLLQEELHIPLDSVTADLFQPGMLDSVGLVHLIFHIEEHFGLRLPVDELDLDSFRSVLGVAQLVADRKEFKLRPAGGNAS